jgi:hypothetical protein
MFNRFITQIILWRKITIIGEFRFDQENERVKVLRLTSILI